MKNNTPGDRLAYYTVRESNTICTVGVSLTIFTLTVLATVLIII